MVCSGKLERTLCCFRVEIVATLEVVASTDVRLCSGRGGKKVAVSVCG